LGDEIEAEMAGECSTYERHGKFIQYFDWKNLKGRDHLEDLDIDGEIILEWIFRK
jgi:hypothetical protein